MSSFAAFITCLTLSVLFFLAANAYLIFSSIKLNKKIRESGLIVSAYPVVIIQNSLPTQINTENNRSQALSPDDISPPPAYQETSLSTVPPHMTDEASAPTAPPPYVKEMPKNF